MPTVSGIESVEPHDPAEALEAAMKGVGVVWLEPEPPAAGVAATATPPTTGPVWHVWSEGACYLLTGPGEQPLPGIVPGGRCEVTARNTAGARVITWAATVDELDPSGAEWAAVAPKLAAGRLNGGDPVRVVPTWPGRLSILRLCPTGDQVTVLSGLSDASHAAPPQASLATTTYRMPSDIMRGRRRRRAAKRNQS